MTPEQFKKLLKKKQKEINQAFSRTLPVKVGTEAVKFVRENFREEGFVDSKLEKWKPAKRKSPAFLPAAMFCRSTIWWTMFRRKRSGQAVARLPWF